MVEEEAVGEVQPLRTTDARPVVDGTTLSSAELRAQVRALQDGRDEQVAEAREDLVDSLAALDQGLRLLRTRLRAKATQVAKVAGGVAAVGAGIAGAALLWAKAAH